MEADPATQRAHSTTSKLRLKSSAIDDRGWLQMRRIAAERRGPWLSAHTRRSSARSSETREMRARCSRKPAVRQASIMSAMPP